MFKGHDLANMSLDEEIALTEYVISENAKEAKEEEKLKKK